ncbi:hypothetical protein DSO57_1020182 [Entomophthora muscae]|uniref:Uncharacterized protein n=1 Tax=Entomophthora muscae TaxID=34485 RepID=A0ACC2RUU3_9FUNG|nr:hypothetical protein DSO57_1020182 [Entomophthora muscae]
MFFYLFLVVPGWVLTESVEHTFHNGKIKVDLICESKDSVCDGFKETVKHVAKLLENALSLKEEIYAKVEVGHNSYMDKKGYGLATTYVGNDRNEFTPGTIIPRALCNQIGSCKPTYYDFIVCVNQNQPFYFASDFGKNEVGSSAIDTLAHEFIHGLGFLDCFSENSCSANLVPFFITRRVHIQNTTVFKFYANSFVEHIYTKDDVKLTSLIDLYIEKEPFPVGSPSRWKVQPTEYHLGIAKKIEALATTKGGLYFKTLNGNKVILDTDGEYDFYSSVFHLDQMYNETREALMTKDLRLAKGIHNMEADGWLTSPFGPLTLEILETMGYQLNPKPIYEDSLIGLKEKMKSSS